MQPTAPIVVPGRGLDTSPTLCGGTRAPRGTRRSCSCSARRARGCFGKRQKRVSPGPPIRRMEAAVWHLEDSKFLHVSTWYSKSSVRAGARPEELQRLRRARFSTKGLRSRPGRPRAARHWPGRRRRAHRKYAPSGGRTKTGSRSPFRRPCAWSYGRTVRLPHARRERPRCGDLPKATRRLRSPTPGSFARLSAARAKRLTRRHCFSNRCARSGPHESCRLHPSADEGRESPVEGDVEARRVTRQAAAPVPIPGAGRDNSRRAVGVAICTAQAAPLGTPRPGWGTGVAGCDGFFRVSGRERRHATCRQATRRGSCDERSPGSPEWQQAGNERGIRTRT